MKDAIKFTVAMTLALPAIGIGCAFIILDWAIERLTGKKKRDRLSLF